MYVSGKQWRRFKPILRTPKYQADVVKDPRPSFTPTQKWLWCHLAKDDRHEHRWNGAIHSIDLSILYGVKKRRVEFRIKIEDVGSGSGIMIQKWIRRGKDPSLPMRWVLPSQ